MGVPYRIFIEPTNRCSLRCLQCPVGVGHLDKPKKDMSVNEFRKIIDKFGSRLMILNLYGLGEPFINDDIFDMIEYAKSKRCIWVSTHTNAQDFDDIKIDRLLKSGLDSLTVSMDGIDQESYGYYRSGGRFDKVEYFIRKFIKRRKDLGLKGPELILQCLIMKNNEAKIDIYRNKFSLYGADKIVFKSMGVWTGDFSSVRGLLPVDKRYRRYNADNSSLVRRSRRCPDLYSRVFINSAGDIYPCCRDRFQEFRLGNISKDDFSEFWNSEKIKYLRKTHAIENGEKTLCSNCDFSDSYDLMVFGSGVNDVEKNKK